MQLSINKWLRISIANLLLVALLGILMRYKIAFSLPELNQKHLLHAHSHFAFTGWVSQTLYVLMIYFIRNQIQDRYSRKYNFILIANLIVSYGMLLSFIYQGYGAISITFATASILINYLFCAWFFADLKTMMHHPSKKWFLASLLFSILSSLGTFALAYMMVAKLANPNNYLGALYFFLHFQYNGWFLFAAIGLFISWLQQKKPAITINPIVFHLFFWSCIPAYFLSILWANLPVWLYTLAAAGAIAQFTGWIIIIRKLYSKRKMMIHSMNRIGGIVLLLSALALSIKLLLQLGSTIPFVSKLAFGFRPIVIAYLHLVLLAVFTLFLVSYSMINGFLKKNKTTTIGIVVLTIGVFLNEFVLLIQGVAAFSYTPVLFVNEILLAVALVIFIGILILFMSQMKKNGSLFTQP
ncbi:MAG: hypothetical protein ACK5NK_01895 [Niabella sp.]